MAGLISAPVGIRAFKGFAISKFMYENEKIMNQCGREYEIIQKCSLPPIFNSTEIAWPAGTHFCSFDGHGSGTILMVGNSYAMRQIHGFLKELNGRYKTVYLAVQSQCTVFSELNPLKWKCDHIMGQLKKIMSIIRPDVTVVSER